MNSMSIAAQSVEAARPTVRIAPPRRHIDLNLRELWQCRELLYFFVWRDIKIRYKQTAIGAAWAVLQPTLTMAVFSLFFGRLAKMPSEGLPYPIFYYAALLPWMYYAACLQHTTLVVVEHQRVITKVYFPRILLPLSCVLANLLDFAISFVIVLGLLAFYRIKPGVAILWLPCLLMLVVLTALGVGLWLSALNAIYRDIKYVVPFLVQFWMFASPVAYPSTLVPARWRWLYGLNPMTGVIEGFRWALTGHGQAPSLVMGVSAAMVVALVLAGMAYFQKMEGTIADLV